MKYIIKGGKKLQGVIAVSGNKNALFPCIAAALLTKEEVVLENVPDLKDTQVLIQILKKLGVSIEKKDSSLYIKSSQIQRISLPEDLMVKLRGSIVLVGAILGRLGKVNFYHPGGDIIGRRSIQTHMDGFKQLGAIFKKINLKYSLYYPQDKKEQDCEIFLPEASVTATENLVLASVLGKSRVILKNCAQEPHVQDLCNMLISMGAEIEGVGTDAMKIRGVPILKGTRFRIGADFVEVGTYVVAAAVTGGEVEIKGTRNADLDPALIPLKSFGIKMESRGDSIFVYPSKLKAPLKLVTNIWPGFPTDLMSMAIVLATQSKGVVLCHDWMYEGRMFFTDKLITMGAHITLADPHRVVVYGPNGLRGRLLDSPDIRAGMALVVAALIARGKSVISQAELIERGYENAVEKLRDLGADITRESV